MAFDLIDTVTVGSGGTAQINFTSIVAVDDADLKVVISGRSSASGIATEYRIQLNGDSNSVYYTRGIAGDGSSSPSTRTVGPTTFWENLSLQKNGATANTFGNAELYIPNFSQPTSGGYMGAAAAFMAVSENNATEAYQGFAAFYRDVDEAVTSIKIYATVGNFMEHTTAYLYQLS
tara:strand:- start:343 stop:870 length:528 start_codon:yes stop_codon:yes gene_type:complete